MRKRDLGILLLSAFAIFFSLQNEGSFSYREAWVHLLDDASPIIHEAERLPPPVVTDLNGDGMSEILIATHDKIQILEPHISSADEGFTIARVLAEVSLLPNNVRVGAGRRPVALAAGEVKRVYNSGEKKKQVIVVVTAGWAVMCFDHNLKKLWEDDIQEDFPHGSHHKEVAISISNYTLRHGDTGLIIVGGSMEVQPQVYLDPFEEEILAEKEAERHRWSAGANETAEDVAAHGGAGKERHFSYYAYAGLSGARRWSQKSEDFHRDPQAMTLTPQHNYKLDASSLTNRHINEVECREYRESVLGVMPHRWDRRDDTRFELAHFRKLRRRSTKKQPGKKSYLPSQKPHEKDVPGKDAGNKVSGVLGKAAELAVGAKPRKQAIQYVPMITNHTSHWWIPNVVVAHLKEGIEAVHLATGRTVCKLLLMEGGLHADVNGDGILDHVQAVGGHGAERVVPAGMTEAIKPCWAIATSGVPVKEQLFNGSICRHSPFLSFAQGEFGSRAFGRNADSSAPLEVATPVLLPRPDGRRHRKNSHGDVIFLTSRGEVTSFSLTGSKGAVEGQEARRKWQIITGATWSNPPAFLGVSTENIVPTLEAIPLRKSGQPEAILVAGELEAVVLSPSGGRLATISLPSQPVAPLLCVDFSGDGLNDLILLTQHAVFGYVQTRQPGAILFSTLLGVLIVVMAVIFLTQNIGSAKGKPSRHIDRRSSDLTQSLRG